MILDQKDLNGATWAKLKAYYLARKQRLLEQCGHDCPEEQTIKLRGRILEIEMFLAIEREDELPMAEQAPE